jgi:hypothetical protein
MPTLLELFENKQYLQYDNKTAKQYNDIRNSKDSNVESLDYVVDKIGASIVNIARKKNSEKGAETMLEEERTGLLVYGQAASIPLYGTEIVRIDGKSTPSITSMRTLNQMGAGSNLFSQAASSIIGDAVGSGVVAIGQQAAGLPTTFSAKNLVTAAGAKITNTLTSLIPDVLIPSKVQSIFSSPISSITGRLKSILPSPVLGGSILQSPSNLEAIANAAKATGVGSKLLASAHGTTDQIRNQVIATGLSIAEEKVKNFVADGIKNLLSGKGANVNVDKNAVIVYTPNAKYVNDGGKANADGSIPFTTHFPTDADITKRNDLSTKLVTQWSVGLVPDKPNLKVFSGFHSDWADLLGQAKTPLQQNESTWNNPGAADGDGSPKKYSKVKEKTSLASKRKIDTKHTNLNTYLPYKPDDITNLSLKLGEMGIVDDLDLIPLKFYSVSNDMAVNFISTISGLTETYTPTWDNARFVGSPFNVYTYSSIERSVQFNFKVYSLNPEEHIAAWKRLSFLSSLVYPQKYVGTAGAVVPPFIKFTLGDMFKNKEGFIESLIYTVDDNYPWEIGMDIRDTPNYEAKNYKLPTIIDVGITIRIVEHKNNTYTGLDSTDEKGNIVQIKAGEQSSKLGSKLYGYSTNTYTQPKPKNQNSKPNNPSNAKPNENGAKKGSNGTDLPEVIVKSTPKVHFGQYEIIKLERPNIGVSLGNVKLPEISNVNVISQAYNNPPAVDSSLEGEQYFNP